MRLIALLILLASVGAAAISAQENLCKETTDRAFASIGQNCANLARDSLCYSHPLVEAEFADDSYGEDFSAPSQRASVFGLARVRSSALDAERANWGVVLIHLGAEFPRTYPGPGIVMMLAGDAEVINRSDPTTLVRVVEPLSTAALVETTRFKNPGIIPEPVGSVDTDELLLVDAFDHSGDWLRVVTDRDVSWVERKDVALLGAMEGLPTIGISASFPFSALSLYTGTEFPICDQAEPMIAIQTPEDLPVSLTVNGVDIHISSLVTFQQVHRNALSLTVHRGQVTTTFGQIVQQGESIIGILGREDESGAKVLDWSGALPASDAEIARGRRAQEALNSLARVNGWPEEKTFSFPSELVHVVERGETLYRIARRYDTSVAAIILANLGDEPINLYSGTELVIPDPGSGFAGHGSVPLDATRKK